MSPKTNQLEKLKSLPIILKERSKEEKLTEQQLLKWLGLHLIK